MTLAENLAEMERGREHYWTRYPVTSSAKLRWRAHAVRHCFHVLPGETILELGAGTGLWTQHLAQVFGGESPITAVVFNADYAKAAGAKRLSGVRFVGVRDLSELPDESFDYVVGTAILCHNLYPENLAQILRLLKPGGEFLFFEANHWNPQVYLKDVIRPLGRWMGNARCQSGLRHFRLMEIASQEGFTHIQVCPYDLLHPLTPAFLIPLIQDLAFVLEHTPVVRALCGTLYIWARKPGNSVERRPKDSLCRHPSLLDSVSVVVPCHNEEMNVAIVIEQLMLRYGAYIHEIIIVNDNSTDRTSEIARQAALRFPSVKIIDRSPPNGVGLALRDGYRAATGKYILTIDCDFVQLFPEFRDLFQAVADGYDGAIGSRFSRQSMLINYPFLKTLANRGFHLLVNQLLPIQVRDSSNNLKLYRAEILKGIEIEQPGFAANAETGLKPLLAGYRIKEVPISWINRTTGMGHSSFRVLTVAPDYLMALLKVVWSARRSHRSEAPQDQDLAVACSSATAIGTDRHFPKRYPPRVEDLGVVRGARDEPKRAESRGTHR